MDQRFGGDWTEEKLARLSKYLVEYTRIMRQQPFKFAYIDAFAGTGYRETKEKDSTGQLTFPEMAEDEPQAFLEGSVRVALKVDPPFQTFIFIEANLGKKEILEQMVAKDFPDKKVTIHHGDANLILKELCNKKNWKSHRAVLFLDPFGMQVEWSTLEAVARTQAIDMWLLFPLGSSVNRLLRKDGDIPNAWVTRLNTLFGTDSWKEAFYQTKTMLTLFGDETRREKAASFQGISNYFIKRLEEIFVGVSKHPRLLYNSKNIPLFLLCFAAGNPTGAPIAVRIADHILKKEI